MFRAMALKEFREIRGIALLALVAYGLLVAAAIDPASSLNLFSLFGSSGRSEMHVPFVNDAFSGKFFMISVIFTIALGMRQTLGESIRGTYPFLLHRPADRRRLMATKLLVGTITCVICTAAPILLYGCWAATPGTHASPFEWSMTVPVWVGWFAMTLLYLGAFHSGVRPGRWYRSRLLPLAAAAFAAFAAAEIAVELEVVLWPCLIVLVVDVWLIAMILFAVQTRDYP
jgi:ABC-type transport system involved in multi-copper enzyme maturation permease subunit